MEAAVEASSLERKRPPRWDVRNGGNSRWMAKPLRFHFHVRGCDHYRDREREAREHGGLPCYFSFGCVVDGVVVCVLMSSLMLICSLSFCLCCLV